MNTLLYIASTGYSGSTLLESLLGTNDSCFNVGEAYKIGWWKTCACGEELDSCPFWERVSQGLEEHSRFGSRIREHHISGKRKRSRLPSLHDAFILSGSPRNRAAFQLSPEVRAFQEGCRRALTLFEEVSRVASAPIIVDSSKDPVLLKHLYTLCPDRLRVIHLVRDARAVAWSHVNNYQRDGATYPSEQSGRRPTIVEAAGYWRRRNRNILLATRNLPADQKLTIRHEDICSSPANCANQISKLVGEPISLPEVFSPRVQHSIAGNPMRNSDQPVHLTFREDWREKLESGDLENVESEAGTMNRQFGYP